MYLSLPYLYEDRCYEAPKIDNEPTLVLVVLKIIFFNLIQNICRVIDSPLELVSEFISCMELYSTFDVSS